MNFSKEKKTLFGVQVSEHERRNNFFSVQIYISEKNSNYFTKKKVGIFISLSIEIHD